jgi:hypothetical protein
MATTTPQRDVKRTKRESAMILADWADDLLVQVFGVTLIATNMAASPGSGTSAVSYNEALATDLASSSAEAEAPLDESLFDKVLLAQCMREIENFQPADYLLACYRRAVTVGKAAIPLRLLPKGTSETTITELRNAALK